MEKRKPLTRLQFARLALEQEGKCACCAEKLGFSRSQPDTSTNGARND